MAEDDRRLEHIVIGRGVAFNKRAMDDIDEKTIEKIFVLQSQQTMDSFLKLLDEIPVNYLELTNRVVELAEKELNVSFDESVYIGLADHITYALSRKKNSTELKNVLLWEIKQFYPKEFKTSEKALKLIHYYENVLLSEDEAAFIALHFVNGQQDGEEMRQTVLTTEIIHEIITIVRYQFKIELKEDSLNYIRFISHLKFFIRRVFSKNLSNMKNFDMYEDVSEKFPEISDCVNKISGYLEKRLDIKIFNEEKFYLILHINRVVNN